MFLLLNRLVTSRITLGLVLLVLFGAAVWLGGPKLVIDGARPLASQSARLVAIGALAVLFLALELLRRWRLHRLNRRILDDLGAVAGETGYADRLGRVREGFAHLCDTVAAHSGSRRASRRHLRELAWYLLLGESGAGRTTLLADSELALALDTADGASEAMRYCGWRVTEEAVLIDAPGGFVTRSHVGADIEAEAEWSDLLECLRSTRRRQPLSGVVLTIPVQRLMGEPTPNEVADLVRRRLQEVMARFGAALPVYILVTQCDRMAGFEELFAGIDAEERGRHLGFSLPLHRRRPADARRRSEGARRARLQSNGALAAFAGRFRDFTERLTDWAAVRIAAERQAGRRRRIFGFPQQVQALGAPLETVLRRIFGPSRFRRDALLRGVYFCSARQHEAPIDTLMLAHEAAWELRPPALPPPAPTPRHTSFFFRGLLHDVLLPERSLVERDPALARRPRRAAVLVSALVCASVPALYAAWWLADERAERQVRTVAQALDAHEAARATLARADFMRAAEAVASLRPQSHEATKTEAGLPPVERMEVAARQAAEGMSRFGAFTLRIPAALAQRTEDVYTRASHTIVRPAVVRDLGAEVATLARSATPATDRLAGLFALYLSLAETDRFDVERLSRWASGHAQGRHRLDPDRQADIVAVVTDAFDPLTAPQPLDDTVVAAARRRLFARPPSERLYARIKAEAMRDDAVHRAPLTLASALGERTAGVFAAAAGPGAPLPKVPEYFSESGYYERFLPGLPGALHTRRQKEWLEGATVGVDDEALLAGVSTRYAQDYIAAWNAFLDRLALPRVDTTAQALRLLEILLSSESPLDALVELVSTHTVLPVVRGAAPEAEHGTSATGEAAGGGMLATLRATADEATQDATGRQDDTWPGAEVRRAFAPYHALRDGRTGSLPGLDAIRARLGDLHATLAVTSGEPDPHAAAFDTVRGWVDDPRKAEIGALRRAADPQPAALRRMLLDLSDQSLALLMRSARQHLQGRWRRDVLRECLRAVAGRYPVVDDAEPHIAPDDFEAFFSADGTLARFFAHHVQPFIEARDARSGGAWRERALHGRTLGFSEHALAALRNAAAIRDAFGLDSATLADLGFTLTPVHLDNRATRITVQTEHATIHYRHEPPRRFRMKLVDEMVTISVTERTGAIHVSRLHTPWAWLRAFDRFRLDPSTVSGRFDLAVEIEGLMASFRIDADSTVNPLSLPALQAFRCEERLL